MAEYKQGDVVDSLYGRARVDRRVADAPGGIAMYQCTPLHWTLAQKCIPVFNLNAESMNLVVLDKGTDVRTNYGGKGVIREIRSTPQAKHFIVTLKNWRLAQGQSPILYLEPASVFM